MGISLLSSVAGAMVLPPNGYSVNCKFHITQKMDRIVCSALPETAASVVVTSIAVGAAVTLLRKRTQALESVNSNFEPCEDCGGSGICIECKGEGFILKKRTDESADRARNTAKNMATRYTSGLPKKWGYCSKCNSTRSCITCSGSGQVDVQSSSS
ncbi:hypothetical protein ZOSMA_2G01660 [Zostera marina]|uniref:DUF7895 domain-containing protein n=1 Tax=Zostera marina TaxID=29655 RepID=A0A0K9PD80_ZOSMR|nr:hypothetical protein ZOSMA_2G01660 [Zostera marina]